MKTIFSGLKTSQSKSALFYVCASMAHVNSSSYVGYMIVFPLADKSRLGDRSEFYQDSVRMAGHIPPVALCVDAGTAGHISPVSVLKHIDIK